MEKYMKRFAAVIFALVIAVCTCTLSYAAEQAYSGYCGAQGDNITWELDADGKTLRISGTGAMADYSFDYYDRAPWYFAGETITSIEIEKGVTEIGAYAFSEINSLLSITLPEKVEFIHEGAFNACAKLTSVTFPLSLQQIGNKAFEDCLRLNKVYYNGSEAQWTKNITVGEDNERLDKCFYIYSNSFVTGDATGDGRITVSDVLAVRKYLAGVETPEGFVAAACDVSGDGKVTVADILKIRKYVAGIINSFPADN